jgi:hypothetical protein
VCSGQSLQTPGQGLLAWIETVAQENSERHRNPYSTLQFHGILLFFHDLSFLVRDAVKLANQVVDGPVG